MYLWCRGSKVKVLLSELSRLVEGGSMEVDILAEQQYMNGLLNQETPIGKGTIIEYVVLTTLKDCMKESFNFQYDLTSKRLGEINVKSSARHDSKNGSEWFFGKRPDSYVPDYYVCVGLDNEFKNVTHVWIIPGSSRVVGSYGIHVIDNSKGLKRVAKYEVDHTLYNEVFQNIDITMFPEFKNIDNDTFKQNRNIAQSINEGYTLDKIKAEYGEEYYQDYLKWVSYNNLKKYFNINTGLVGILPSYVFIEMTEFTFPVFDIQGNYAGYVNVHDFIRNRIKQDERTRREEIRSVWDAIKQLTANGEHANINDIRCKANIEDIEMFLTWMTRYGDIEKVSQTEYICKNKDNQGECITERMLIVRKAFRQLSRLYTNISLKQIEAVSGLNNIDTEIQFLKKRGDILQSNSGDFKWV